MAEPRIVHRDSVSAQKALYPLGTVVRVSDNAAHLIQDLRDESCKFGQATDAKDVEAAYERMQMRMRDLAQYVSVLERHFRTIQGTTLKF